MKIQSNMRQVDNNVDTTKNHLDFRCACGYEHYDLKCYFGDTTSRDTALDNMIILCLDGGDPETRYLVEFTYVDCPGVASPCLKNYVKKRFNYDLSNYESESIEKMEECLRVKVIQPPHSKKELDEIYAKDFFAHWKGKSLQKPFNEQ